MRRVLILGAAMLALAVPLTAGADSPHFKHGGIPTCSDIGNFLRCTGSLAGLGNDDLRIELTADALASFLCENKGGNQAPGQNKVPFTASAETTIPKDEIKNGNVTFTITAPEELPTPTAKEAGCPNNNWKAILATGVDFSNIVLTISQSTLLFTCERSGPVPSSGSVTLTCSS